MDPYTAAETAYKNGYEAGKAFATEQIFKELESLHLHITNEFDVRRYEELKKKYGVN